MLTAFINDDESVLDVGCGPGWNYDHFREHGPIVSYTGVDYSERFVRVANQRTDNQDLFELGDCRKLKFADNSFDVVILQDVLEHTNGYKVPIQEALRVAKKRVVMTFWRAMRDDQAGDQINDDGDDGYGATYAKGKLERYLDSLGYFWTQIETNPGANRHHLFYIIDKEEKHESI